MSKERFRKVFEEGPLALLVLQRDGRIASANSIACRLLGCSSQELKNRSYRDFVQPDRLAATDAQAAAALAAGRISAHRSQKRYVRGDGSVFSGVLTLSAIRDRSGRLREYLGMLEELPGKRGETSIAPNGRNHTALAGARRTKGVQVALADDHRLFREGLRSLLASDARLVVVEDVADGQAALELVSRLSPQVLVTSVALPGLDGVELTRRIVARGTQTRVLGLSHRSDNQVVADMLAAGATGFLSTGCSASELIQAVLRVAEGRTYLGKTIAKPSHSPAESRPLSPRERAVLKLIADGHSTRQVAEFLGISVKTAEAHRAHIQDKLNARSTAALTRIAIARGLIEP